MSRAVHLHRPNGGHTGQLISRASLHSLIGEGELWTNAKRVDVRGEDVHNAADQMHVTR